VSAGFTADAAHELADAHRRHPRPGPRWPWARQADADERRRALQATLAGRRPGGARRRAAVDAGAAGGRRRAGCRPPVPADLSALARPWLKPPSTRCPGLGPRDWRSEVQAPAACLVAAGDALLTQVLLRNLLDNASR